MNKQTVMLEDEEVLRLTEEFKEQKKALQQASGSLIKRMIEVMKENDVEVPDAPQIVKSILTGIEEDIMIRTVDIVDPDWKQKVIDKLGLTEEDLNRAVAMMTGQIGADVPEKKHLH